MFRRIVRFLFLAAVATGAGAAVAKLVQSRRSAQDMPGASDWLPPKRPEKPLVEPEMLHGLSLKKEPATEDGEARTDAPSWLEPGEDGACPSSHPVKAKMSSGIYHLPGMLAYERTVADRCYPDEAAAEADGLRKAKR